MSSNAIAALLFTPLLALFLGGNLCRGGKNVGRSNGWIRGVPWMCALLLLTTLTASLWTFAKPASVWSIGSWQLLHWDATAAIMLTLVCFIGWVVSRYSLRYLDGEDGYGRFFANLATTIAFLGLAVIAGNLLMLFLSWVAASLGLHGLLTHYHDRPGARRGAWSKWIVSRLGDLPLLAALAWIYFRFETWNFVDLFQASTALHEASQPTYDLKAIGLLLALGAAIKSAQWPFHFWLPDTLEAPTPVSALMHAGIVNAGGYLMVRMSPMLVEAQAAHQFLIAIGSATALMAGIVAMTQTSIKRTLVYSTILQMGIMMLQCGLGAYTAAIVHIVAHSLYKSYAFLTSGEVLSQSRKLVPITTMTARPMSPVASLIVAAFWTVTACTLASTLTNLSLMNKPGGVLLATLLCLGLTRRLWYQLRHGGASEIVSGFTTTMGLCFAYAIGFRLINTWTIATIPSVTVTPPNGLFSLLVLVPFIALLAMETRVAHGMSSRLLERLYVHAANGFYADTLPRWIQKSWST